MELGMRKFIQGTKFNKRPIPNCRPGYKDDQKLIRDLYQIRTTRMHFFPKINKRPGSSIRYLRVHIPKAVR